MRLKYLTLPIIALAIGLAIHFAPTQQAMAGGNEDNVTICHHTSSAQNTWVTITINQNALQTHLGHGDTLGHCPPLPTATSIPPTRVPPTATSVPPTSTPPVDVCRNLEGIQTSPPAGYIVLESGRCVLADCLNSERYRNAHPTECNPPTATNVPPTATPIPATPTPLPVTLTQCEQYSGFIGGVQFFGVWANVTRVNGVVTSAFLAPGCAPVTATTCEFLSQNQFNNYGLVNFGIFQAPLINGWFLVTRTNGAISGAQPSTPNCLPIAPPIATPVIVTVERVVQVPVPVSVPAKAGLIAPPRTGDGGLLSD